VTEGPTVVKVGGNELEDAGWVASLAGALATLRGPTVVVHGGGREVSALQRQLGAEPEWRDGLRVTTPEALRVLRMTLSGVVNKRLVAALVAAGVEALGVSGEDAALVRARTARGGLLGRVGEVESVRADVLLRLIAVGFTPVVSPVARGLDGEPLNVNADDSAAAIAAALGAARLLFVSNVPGVLRDGRVAPAIGVDEVESWIEAGIATDGMRPKLRAAAAAARSVAEVRLGDLSVLGGGGTGTRVGQGAHVALPV
jgi:acetylglutamate kinase